MPSLIDRIARFSRTPQARGLLGQVQDRLAGSGGGKGRPKGRDRAAGRRAAARGRRNRGR